MTTYGNEKEKVKLFNAHLGNEARKFVHNVNLREMETVCQLHEVFRKTLSDRYDWYNVLTTIKQKPDEQIRNYAVRVRIAATKCGFVGDMLETACINCIKTTCLPMFKPIMPTVLSQTPFDILLDHAIQFERTEEVAPEFAPKTDQSDSMFVITALNRTILSMNASKLALPIRKKSAKL